jgi:hypothetical protein
MLMILLSRMLLPVTWQYYLSPVFIGMRVSRREIASKDKGVEQDWQFVKLVKYPSLQKLPFVL